MNKKICLMFTIFALIFVVTGCGKKSKMTCTIEQKFGTAILKTEMKLEFKNDHLVSTSTKMSADFSDESTAKGFADTYSNKENYEVKKDGTKVEVKSGTKIDSKDQKSESNKKSEVKKYLEDRNYTCK